MGLELSKEICMDGVMYCPICGHEIEASNKKEVENGEHASYIYIHDEIPHEDEDIEALENGIN
jgi:uncharacterized Zn finger protein (UPF0148 family)